jgi:hypothetical protein
MARQKRPVVKICLLPKMVMSHQLKRVPTNAAPYRPMVIEKELLVSRPACWKKYVE